METCESGGNMSEWISVEDKLPEVETLLLMYVFPNTIKIGFYNTQYHSPYWETVLGNSVEVTHWTPLPPPPQTCPKCKSVHCVCGARSDDCVFIPAPPENK